MPNNNNLNWDRGWAEGAAIVARQEAVRLDAWRNAAGVLVQDDLPNVPEPVLQAFKVLKPREENAPPLWDKLLEAVREIYEPEYACVAGGAVRDYLMKRVPKDIDIFITMKEVDIDKLLDEANCLGWTDPQLVGNPGAYGANRKVAVVIGANVFGYRVELIFQGEASGEEIVKGFDFGICQHWYDGEVNPIAAEYGIHSTNAGAYGIKSRKWMPLMKLDAVLREHFDRVNKRHGGIYTLDEGEPWYMQFAGKEKIK